MTTKTEDTLTSPATDACIFINENKQRTPCLSHSKGVRLSRAGCSPIRRTKMSSLQVDARLCLVWSLWCPLTHVKVHLVRWHLNSKPNSNPRAIGSKVNFVQETQDHLQVHEDPSRHIPGKSGSSSSRNPKAPSVSHNWFDKSTFFSRLWST